jgi:dTMP kinase
LGRSGYIISIEGIDAVGKQTQTLLLEAWLRKNKMATVTLSFPDYETPIGKEIHSFLSGNRSLLPELQHMLFAANRWEKAPLINRYREAGRTIVINRYSESNIVYGMANGLDIEWLKTLEEGLPKSDTVIVLDAPVKGLLSRRGKSRDSYEKSVRLQERARKLYKDLAPRFGWNVVDAGGDKETVHESIVEVVKKRMNLGARDKRR